MRNVSMLAATRAALFSRFRRPSRKHATHSLMKRGVEFSELSKRKILCAFKKSNQKD